MSNKKIANVLHDKLAEEFEDPYFALDSFVDDQAVFNYPNFWDSRSDHSKYIQEEREWLINQKDCLKEEGYQGYIYIADDALKITD